MKILHCCLAAFYIDRYGYQENIMPRMHKMQGNDVYILASTETYISANKLGLTIPSTYWNEDGIKVTRVPYVNLLSKSLTRKLRVYKGVYDILEQFHPDIIFMHDAQTAAVFQIIKYIKSHPRVQLYIDSHTDFINSAKGWVSKNILHRVLYRYYVRKTIPYTVKYYGTLPARVDFYTNFYGTPKSKTEYLPLGIDDLSIDFNSREIVRNEIRSILGFRQNDFVIITGGKLESRKCTIELIKAFRNVNNKNSKLLLFGSIKDDIKAEWEQLIDSDERIKYIGWLSANETYKYFFASDLACFPGTHSTLWEESIGYGIPAIFRKWKGIEHVNCGGNCIMLDDSSIDNIKKVLNSIIDDIALYQKMLAFAQSEDVMGKFAYSNISRYAIAKDN